MLDGCEVGGGVLGADAPFVIAEHHVHDPVHAFDRPVNRTGNPGGRFG
jgi:hypothetical protein